MNKDNVIAFDSPLTQDDDLLNEVNSRGAANLLFPTIENEAETLLTQYPRHDELRANKRRFKMVS